MKTLVIDGKKYISSKQAAEIMGYTQDYVGQLARSGKISAQRISGIWYVNESSVLSSVKSTPIKKTYTDDSTSVHNKSHSNSLKEDKVKDELTDSLNRKNITFEGVDYISSKRAAEIMGYTQDYVGQLARSGKISARQIGRGWYIPRSIVYKTNEDDKNKSEENKKNKVSKQVVKQEIKTNDPNTDEIRKRESLGDIVIFNNNKDVNSSQDKTNKNFVTHTNKEVQSLDDKDNKNEYYYPSFLSAVYSFDDTPLVPVPRRSREPILHKIVAKERDETFRNSTEMYKSRGLNRIHTQKTVKYALEPKKQWLVQKSPMSLMKVASLAVSVVVIASVITFTPSTSVFSSNTGTLRTVFLLEAIRGNTLKAEAVTSVSKTHIIETIMDVLFNIFKSEIEYKSK